MNINRKTAKQIIQAAIAAVNPYNAVKLHLSCQDNKLHCGHEMHDLSQVNRVYVLGFGKGSAPMAQAVWDCLGSKVTGGWVIVKYGHTLRSETDLGPIQIVEAGHPLPDRNGLAHSRVLQQMARQVTADDLVICVISGGGSALLTLPVDGISLDDVQRLTDQLLRVGATITEINQIRKHLSQVKGGRLAEALAPATTLNLVLSDVGGDPLDIIASGPTVADQSTYQDALAVLERYQLQESCPRSILAHLQAGAAGQRPETPKPGQALFQTMHNHIVANNAMAVQAAAAEAHNLGFETIVPNTFVEGEARDVAQEIAHQLLKLRYPAGPARALILGGETTVTLRGHGKGGRNQELALAAASALANQDNLLLACCATDGNDGPTDAAGAFVDGQTLSRAKALGLEANTYLANNDSYHFFQALEDLIITGPTNTNVNDLVVALVQ